MKRLAVYLMCGRGTPQLAEAAVDGGADLIELGFPFSDPLADGPVVRAAAERALGEGMRTQACLECLARTRELVDVPIVPMTYASLFEAYGWERLAADARAAGADSLIVADLPADEQPELDRVHLVAPTSTAERIEMISRVSSGFIYVVARTGVTGMREAMAQEVRKIVARVRRASDLPVAVGFGISQPEHVREVWSYADAAVVGVPGRTTEPVVGHDHVGGEVHEVLGQPVGRLIEGYVDQAPLSRR